MFILEGLFVLFEAFACLSGLIEIPFLFWSLITGKGWSSKSKLTDGERKSWQKIAEESGLRYIDHYDGIGLSLRGIYKGHSVVLNTNKSFGKFYTVISVEKHQNVDIQPEKNTLSQLTDTIQRRALYGRVELAQNGKSICYKQEGIETNTRYMLYLLDVLGNLINSYPTIISSGGKSVPILKRWIESSEYLKPLANQLLKQIGQETTHRLKESTSHFVCPNCMTRCAKYKLRTSKYAIYPVIYYGCRKCGQSYDLLKTEGDIVAVLDQNMGLPYQSQNGLLSVNWFEYETRFDFDKVFVRQATDQEVERFVIQTQNDANQKWSIQYQDMVCQVSEQCTLSENTLSILRRHFGQVKIVPIQSKLTEVTA